ncbi:hypothetical protein NOX22_01690 [Enterobacter cloacae]|uniref:hypothetical protein n=1 Tax=Enterobacter cloacae complex TaxID=354276 RepID=UPI00210CFF7A|nr:MULTISPECIES: hypothetical protein [Enterobacter cloacae complex]MCQ4443319.1 hypothetical protein [Enterobacter cloacae]MDW2867219.1 hypothetical protein [Enterobacter hormaechei]
MQNSTAPVGLLNRSQSWKKFQALLTVLNKIGYQLSTNQLFPATATPPVSEVNGGVNIPAEQQFRSGIASMKVRSVPEANLDFGRY